MLQCAHCSNSGAPNPELNTAPAGIATGPQRKCSETVEIRSQWREKFGWLAGAAMEGWELGDGGGPAGAVVPCMSTSTRPAVAVGQRGREPLVGGFWLVGGQTAAFFRRPRPALRRAGWWRIRCEPCAACRVRRWLLAMAQPPRCCIACHAWLPSRRAHALAS
jgi:hypothetical protein